jgi:hypothetical protein
MEANWGSGGITARIHDFCSRWRRVLSFTPHPFYPQGENPCYPLDRRLAGPQSRSGCEVNDQIRMLRNEELGDSYKPPNVVRIMKWCDRRVDGGNKKCMQNFGEGKFLENIRLGHVSGDGRVPLGWIWRKWVVRNWGGWIWLKFVSGGGFWY